MPRRHFPKNLIFLMIFSLVSLQIYPLGFVLAAEPGAEVSSDDFADKTTDKTETNKKDSAKEAYDKITEEVDKKDEVTGDKKNTEKRETDAEDTGQKEEILAASETVDAETVDEKAVPDATESAAPTALVTAEPSADATEQTDTTENNSSEEVHTSLPDSEAPVENLPVDVLPSSETENSTDSAQSLESKTTPETAAPDLSLTNNSSPDNSEELAVVNTNDTTVENVSATSSDTGGNGAETSSAEQPLVATPEDAMEMLPTDDESKTTEETPQPAEAPADPATISTGDAESVTVVKNNLNTNVTTENGTVSNIDIYDYTGDINLLQAFNEVLAKAKTVADSNTGAISLAIQNINSAVVDNRVSTTSSTGENAATGDGASITTGDATAVTDIVNYINTNIVGNNWLYATLNIFGNWNGNLIVPGEGLLNVSAPRNFLSVNILNENSVAVTNDVSTTADTGGNLAAGNSADGASIQTGSATARTNVVNILNTNIVKNNWFMLLFNNMGSWTGQLLNWGSDSSSAFAYDLGSFTLPGEPFGTLSVINQNNAQIANSVATIAETGNNSATGNAGGASVTTGNASAFSNIFNMINTNIIGDNWFFGVVNNMGNWKGNVEFAYPDLAVALVTDKAAVSPGETVNYTVHYKNLGSADSGATQLSVNLPSDLRAEKTTWEISGLKAGEEGSVELRAEVKSDARAGEILRSTANISTETKEVNLDNNSDSDETGVYDANFASSSSDDDLNSKLIVKRSSTVTDQAKPGDRVKNTIVVENKSDNSLYNVSVSDKMLIADGTKLADFAWPIGKIKKGSKVMIQYEFIVNNPGQVVAVNYVAKATGQDLTGHEVTSHKASDWLTVLGFVSSAYAATDVETPMVAGAETHSDTPAGIFLQDAPAAPLGWPLWLWLASVVAYALYSLDKRFLMRKRLTG